MICDIFVLQSPRSLQHLNRSGRSCTLKAGVTCRYPPVFLWCRLSAVDTIS
ncbi:hypothetical protein ISS30_00095 [bacterium]|nr:hypothetical protein [bacterium]